MHSKHLSSNFCETCTSFFGLALGPDRVGPRQLIATATDGVLQPTACCNRGLCIHRLDDGIVVIDMESDRDAAELTLLANLREQRANLAALYSRQSDHWGFEDPIYRFYHQSWKVFALQSQTAAIVSMLHRLVPERELHPWFADIVNRGTGRTFSMSDNQRWPEATAPIVEAFFHARYFLEMAVRYSELDRPPRPMPSGYAALLYLYGLR